MLNSTRSASEAVSIIARRTAERAAAINLAPADEIGPVCDMVTTFLDQMMAGISSTEASRLLYRMIDRMIGSTSWTTTYCKASIRRLRERHFRII
jgi:hypothetical protein